MSSTSTSRKGLSRIALNRLQKELNEWQSNPPTGFKHKATDNLQRWIIEVAGAPETLYDNEVFQLQVDFPEHYPMEAPQVIFLQPTPMHAHIYSNGHICLEGIKEAHSKVLLASIDINQHIGRFSQANVEKTTVLVKKKIEINEAREKM